MTTRALTFALLAASAWQAAAQQPARYLIEEGFIDSAGVLIYYKSFGQGSPLMIVSESSQNLECPLAMFWPPIRQPGGSAEMQGSCAADGTAWGGQDHRVAGAAQRRVHPDVLGGEEGIAENVQGDRDAAQDRDGQADPPEAPALQHDRLTRRSQGAERAQQVHAGPAS